MRSPTLSRRALLQTAAAALFAPTAAAVASMVDRLDLGCPPRQIRVTPDPDRPVTFAGDVLAVRSDRDEVRIFSARCTHLGCRLNRVEGDEIGRLERGASREAGDNVQMRSALPPPPEIVCPCHGSRFHLDGSVARGPAARPLAPLPFRREGRRGDLLVDLG